jgi:transcriptional regulator with XRE-family HTH domain
VSVEELLESARLEAGLSQEELARRAHTSRTTLSAYENGRKSPTLATAQRLLEQTGHELVLAPRMGFEQRPLARGRVSHVPNVLPQLAPRRALARVTLPLRLNWSDSGRVFHLADRAQRARVYEIVLREGGPEDVRTYVDGALLVDLWDDLVLPRDVRAAWQPLIDATLGDATLTDATATDLAG